jgi:hypothetical protein
MGCKINAYWQTGKIKFLFLLTAKTFITEALLFPSSFFLKKKKQKFKEKRWAPPFFRPTPREHHAATSAAKWMLLI